MAASNQQGEPYILFELAGTSYAIKSREVLHMEMADHFTPVPNARPFLEGIVFSRGQVIPAVNLRVRFGFPRVPHTAKTRLLVVQSASRVVGLLADSASEFRAIPGESIQPPDEVLNGTTEKFLSGIANLGDRLVLILDLKTTLEILDAEIPGVQPNEQLA
jgi:purine-binding chemotaxis protein CheW